MKPNIQIKDEAVSWRVLRHQLYFKNIINSVDAQPEEIGAALRKHGQTVDDIPALLKFIGLIDGLWAARQALMWDEKDSHA